MKTINKIVTSLFALCLFLGLITTSCTDVVEYDPAERPTNAQVYFSNILKPKIDIPADMNKNSFDIEVRRIDKAEALTVNLKVENESPTLFNVPSTVSFAAGVDLTKITITYDPTKIEFDDYKSIKITVSDDVSSFYGNSVYSFTVGMPAPWKTLGKAQFFETQFTLGTPWEVELQQHEINPNRYRLVDPFADRYLLYYSNVFPNDNADPYFEFIVLPAGGSYTTYNREDGKVTVNTTVNGLVFYEPTNIGLTYEGNGDLSIMHPVGRALSGVDSRDEGYWLYNTVKKWSDDGKPEVVQIAPLYAYAELNWSAHNYSQYDGVITIVFPGVVLVEYDHSISLSYLGHYIDQNDVDNAVIQFTKGADVANYKYTLVEGALGSNAAQEVALAIIDGTIAAEEDTDSGYKIFPLTNAGKYSVVAVSYDENGEAQDFGYVAFEFIPAGMDNPWVSLGFCKYTDDVLISLYTDGDPSYIPTYEVEILEHRDNAGLFRLKNAYGADYPYNDPGDYEEGNVFIEIDATDPDGVFIDYQSMGVDWGYGTHYIYSFASYYMDSGESFEDVKEAGLCGTYKNGIITFPVKGLIITDDDGMYYANLNGMWKVDMTTLRSSAAKKSASLRSSKKPLVIKHQEKAPLSLKSAQPVRVKGKSVPASVIKGNLNLNLNLRITR